MKKFLLKIEEVFDLQGRGLVLFPTIPKETDLPKSSTVLLIRPDGSTLTTEAIFEIPFLSFSRIEDLVKHIPAYQCVLKELDKESVPIETEIWLNQNFHQ